MKKRKVITKHGPPLIPMPEGPIEIPQESTFNKVDLILPREKQNKTQKNKTIISSDTQNSNEINPEINKKTNETDEKLLKYNKELYKNEDYERDKGFQTQSVILDQQIPICKDYFLTGYCTYGWSCKFLHIRDRMLTSYALDRMTEKQDLEEAKKELEKQEKQVIGEMNLCSICKKLCSDPVILKCGHIFCKKCAMDRFKNKITTCFVCGKETEGIFNKYNKNPSK